MGLIAATFVTLSLLSHFRPGLIVYLMDGLAGLSVLFVFYAAKAAWEDRV